MRRREGTRGEVRVLVADQSRKIHVEKIITASDFTAGGLRSVQDTHMHLHSIYYPWHMQNKGRPISFIRANASRS